MKTTHIYTLLAATLAMLAPLGVCDRTAKHTEGDGHDHGTDPSPTAPTPSNRVDIPASVQQNLGITFAKVQPRNVAQTLRVPREFELLPTARREYRVPTPGRVELLVSQYQIVSPRTPLYHVASAQRRDLIEKIAATQARVDSMRPLREAHRVREQNLADKVALWQECVKQLDDPRQAAAASPSVPSLRASSRPSPQPPAGW
jgi:hypothetical protein